MRKICLLFLLCLLSSLSFAQPFRTPTLNGDVGNNFNNNEKVTTGSVTYAMTWDATNLYLGIGGSGMFIKNEPTIWYFDSDTNDPPTGGTGSTSGFNNYDNRTGTLPFTGNVVVYMKSGYAELRTNTSGTWGSATNLTSNIVTGTNDIEITIPWTNFPSGVRPGKMYALVFKTNGNGANTDAYSIMPGGANISNVNSTAFTQYYSIANTNDGGVSNVFGSANVPLPISLTHFSATPKADRIELNWATASEQNNDYMAVEKSAEGRRWEEIGRVAGAGTTTLPQSYTFSDDKPLPGLNYYRLRQVDFDGRFEYHKTIAVDFKGGLSGSLHLFPSPAKDHLNVTLPAAAQQDSELWLLDAQGRVLQRRVVPQGGAQAVFEVSALPEGVYFVRMQGDVRSFRFVR